MRYLSLALMLVVFAIPAAEQSLSSNVATIRLVARLAPHAEITSTSAEPGISARRIAPDRIVLVAAPGDAATATLDFYTNTRATLIKAIAGDSGATVDVAPVTTTCDWVHSEIVLRETRTVASLTGCKPSEAQRALIRIGPRTQPVTMTILIEPLAN